MGRLDLPDVPRDEDRHPHLDVWKKAYADGSADQLATVIYRTQLVPTRLRLALRPGIGHHHKALGVPTKHGPRKRR